MEAELVVAWLVVSAAAREYVECLVMKVLEVLEVLVVLGAKAAAVDLAQVTVALEGDAVTLAEASPEEPAAAAVVVIGAKVAAVDLAQVTEAAWGLAMPVKMVEAAAAALRVTAAAACEETE